jgi:hypothetical protein
MNVCKDCRHCSITYRDSPDLWRCYAPSNGTNPQTGTPKHRWCDHKNHDGRCGDFEPGAGWVRPKPETTHAPSPIPVPRYRSPLWIRLVRWFIQEG